MLFSFAPLGIVAVKKHNKKIEEKRKAFIQRGL
jgi:hypothetical protein